LQVPTRFRLTRRAPRIATRGTVFDRLAQNELDLYLDDAMIANAWLTCRFIDEVPDVFDYSALQQECSTDTSASSTSRQSNRPANSS
jgi:hypothetical protein